MTSACSASTTGAPSTGSDRHCFYMYRAQDASNYPIQNMNLADLAGVLWYLHNEVVVTCPRKFDIDRIRRFKVTMKNSQALYDRTQTQFGPFVAFDSGRCNTPDADKIWQNDGYVVGCQVQRLELGNYRSSDPTATKCERGPDDCYGPVWYSLPGPCPSEYFNGKTRECLTYQPGGSCASDFVGADGHSECTYLIEDAGEVDLNWLTGITGSYTSFCESGAKEYVEATDKGVLVNFWDGKLDQQRCQNRMMAVHNAFAKLYPSFPAHIDPPLCDY